jgi:hypothetical protein
MVFRALVCLLFGALAWAQAAGPGAQVAPPAVPSSQGPAGAAAPGQTPQSNQSSESTNASPSTPVAPDAPVVTIRGLCEQPAINTNGCQTVITRAEFDKMVETLGKDMPPFSGRQFALQYTQMLALANEAHRRGLDRSPHFEEMMRLLRVQTASKEMEAALQDEAAKVPEKDIEDYYREHHDAFVEVSLQRIFIPKSKEQLAYLQQVPDPEAAPPVFEADPAMKVLAEKLRGRAAAGEDFSKLQQEAFQVMGVKAEPPSVNLGKVRSNGLPKDQASILDLKPGEVSQLMTDPTGYSIYKAGEKDIVPLDKVRQEISSALRGKRYNDQRRSIQQSVTPTLNEAYFVQLAAAQREAMRRGNKSITLPDSDPK